MPIVPVGTTNLAAIGVPNVVVQIIPPNPLLNGVPTNIIGVVGIGSWGPVNSPITIGSLQELIQFFGQPLNATYDLGTQVYTSFLQGANNFKCVRVTDGTDVASTVDVLDTASAIGVVLNAIYTGEVGNTLNASMAQGSNYTSSVPTYKLSIWLSGGVPESFDNILGSGTAAFWTNLQNAINMGQGPQRGPSNLARAALPGGISSVTVGAAGTYDSLPTLSATIGTGATLVAHMKTVSATIPSGGAGSGWAGSDTATVIGGTGTATVITIDTVDGSGAILTYHISTAGDYTVLPTNPVSVTPSASGINASFDLEFGLLSVHVSAGGTGYTSGSAFVVTGGGGSGATGTLVISVAASSVAPSLAHNPYIFSGGTNGNSGVTDATMIGSDTASPRSGMYALRNTQASIGNVADQTDATKWSSQIAFGLSEGMYMMGVMANSYDQNIAGAITLKQTNNIASYAFKLMLGDWCQIFDPFNNVTRFVSPAGFVAGILATNLPDGSSLNKIMNGIIATQKTVDQQTYSDADLQSLQSGGIDVITRPIPASNFAFGVRLGINTSGNVTTIGDNYTRMINFLAETFVSGLGGFIGLPQTLDVQQQARATLQSFLQNIQDLGLIGTLNGAPAYSVILDSTNNPSNQVALGYMQANVQVTLWSIIFQFVINLQAGQSVEITVLPPQLI